VQCKSPRAATRTVGPAIRDATIYKS